MRSRRTLALAVALLFAVPALAADPPVKFDPKADLEKLQGVWETAQGAKARVRLEVKKRGLGLRYLAGNRDSTLEVLGMDAFELKETGDERGIELTELVATLFKTGRTIEYKFDKDALVITVAEGDLKGEHTLTRATKK